MFVEKLLLYTVTYFGLFTSVVFLLTFFENRKRLSNPRIRNYSKVTFAVPMYNVADHLRRTVDSLLSLEYPKDLLEIIIIDDGSTDQSLSIAKEYLSFAQVRVLSQKNRGKCAAINNALKESTGEFFAVLDVDAFVSPESLKRMMGFFNNPRVMAVTPSLKVYDPKSFLQKVQALEFLFGVFLRKVFSQLGSIHVTPGCGTVYRKWFFESTGPYQEGNLTEDIEIAYRIQTQGFEIENSIDANVYTLGVRKFKPLMNQRLRWYKGFLDNTQLYRRVFSRKFGNLGVFVLPSAFLSVFMAVVVSAYTISRFVDHSYVNVMNFVHTNYDWSQYFKWHFDPFLINVNAIFVLAFVSFFIMVSYIIIAKRRSQEPQSMLLPYVYFTLVYLYLYAFWWLSAGYYKIRHKKVRWGNLYL